VCHHIAIQTALKNTDKNIDKYTEGHNRTLKSRTFKEGEKVLLKVKDLKLNNRKLCDKWKGPFIITKVFPNQTALLKTQFGKHKTLYNFIILKHYNEEEVNTMAKTQEDAEEMSNKTKSNTPNQTTNNEGPITREKAKEIAKQKELKKLYSNVVKNTHNNLSTQNTQWSYGASETRAQKSSVLPFPIPIPFKTHAYNMTIKQSLNFQESMISKTVYEELFD
jgi:hypothetical protein